MDHDEAIATRAVERYALGEMSEQQAEEFELHFYECVECSSDVDAAQVFALQAREVFTETAEPERETVPQPQIAVQPSFGDRIAAFFALLTTRGALAAATACLALVTAWLTLGVIPGLRRDASAGEPQELASFHLRGAVRGSAPALTVPTGVQHIALSFDPVWETRPSAYACSLQRQDGTVLSTFSLQPPASGAPLSILLPVATLQPGMMYSLSVFAGSQSDVSREPLAQYAFELQNR